MNSPAPKERRFETRDALNAALAADVVAQLTAAGARLVSLNPIRATLEDYFVEQIAKQPEAAGRRM